ncbi:MAG: hypothetical protein MN733_07670 [Nitrososphaera sp.]|nr:hypothetical protein [Nitrososphaera sp.]
MINISDLVRYVVRPTLEKHGPMFRAPAAEQLVVATAYAESNGEFLHQVKGPALSLWQIEPATAGWLFQKYRNYFAAFGYTSLELERLPGDLYLGAFLCRLKYWSINSPLPAEDNWSAIAAYWKKNYNTELGKGTVEGFLKKTAHVQRFYNSLGD